MAINDSINVHCSVLQIIKKSRQTRGGLVGGRKGSVWIGSRSSIPRSVSPRPVTTAQVSPPVTLVGLLLISILCPEHCSHVTKSVNDFFVAGFSEIRGICVYELEKSLNKIERGRSACLYEQLTLSAISLSHYSIETCHL